MINDRCKMAQNGARIYDVITIESMHPFTPQLASIPTGTHITYYMTYAQRLISSAQSNPTSIGVSANSPTSRIAYGNTRLFFIMTRLPRNP